MHLGHASPAPTVDSDRGGSPRCVTAIFASWPLAASLVVTTASTTVALASGPPQQASASADANYPPPPATWGGTLAQWDAFQGWLRTQHDIANYAVARGQSGSVAESTVAPATSCVPYPGVQAGNGTGEDWAYTDPVGSGSGTMYGAGYFNNGGCGAGTGYWDSQWNYNANDGYAAVELDPGQSMQDGWVDIGNGFNYEPSAPAGTLVAVNITAIGTIRGEVAAAGAGADQLKVNLDLEDYTTGSQYNNRTIANVTNPINGDTLVNQSFNTTCSYNLVSGDT